MSMGDTLISDNRTRKKFFFSLINLALGFRLKLKGKLAYMRVYTCVYKCNDIHVDTNVCIHVYTHTEN